MAHAVETMAYAGETPWHGLGVQVEDNLTPQEMLVAAGLDWTVSKRHLFTHADPDVKSVIVITRPLVHVVQGLSLAKTQRLLSFSKSLLTLGT